jgi:hypothetical protein
VNEINAVLAAISATVGDYARRFENYSREAWNFRSAPGKWSKKEILGHLIDSAHVNTDRLIRAQVEEVPSIVYAQDEWVAASCYANIDSAVLIAWWRMLNERLLSTARHCPVENYSRKCRWHDGEVITLAFLLEDYHRHMLHHLAQLDAAS